MSMLCLSGCLLHDGLSTTTRSLGFGLQQLLKALLADTLDGAADTLLDPVISDILLRLGSRCCSLLRHAVVLLSPLLLHLAWCWVSRPGTGGVGEGFREVNQGDGWCEAGSNSEEKNQ